MSQSIFSPGVHADAYESMIPDTVLRADENRKMKNSASVRMHDYRGTTNLWFGYDPSAPVALPKSKVSTKFERIKNLRT